MKFLTILGFLVLSTAANAKLVASHTKTITVDINSAIFEVSAKCVGPKFEDDNFKTYFSEESYNEVKEFLTSSYSWKLLDKSCGYEETNKPQLSFDEYQTVTVLFVDGGSPKKKLEEVIKAIWDSKD